MEKPESIEGMAENVIQPAEKIKTTNGPSDGVYVMNIDCFRELFKFMSLKDICALRQTCKYAKQVIDQSVAVEFPVLKFGCGKIDICDTSADQLRHIQSSDIPFIKRINVSMEKLKKTQTQSFKEILNNVHILEVNISKFDGDFYKDFLRFGANLKSLRISSIDGREIVKGGGNKWLHRRYPGLEHIVFNDLKTKVYCGKETADLKKFFALNPNIRVFSTTFNFLWKNRNWLKKSKITFDQLDLEVGFLYDRHSECVSDLVSQLHKQGFYKRLHFYGTIIHDDEMDQIDSLPALEKLYLRYIDINRNSISTTLVSLKELSFMEQEDFHDLETLADNLAGVERIYISKAKMDGILPFIRRSPKLKKIKVNCLSKVDGKFFKNGVIDVAALNNERKQLAGACILTIYVAEKYFLRTKWANLKTECSLIQLKRAEAYEWNHQFYEM